jgi:4-hydroxybutyrate CoA-transferase
MKDTRTMEWRDEYKRKFVSPEKAVEVVESGDTVVIPIDTEPQALSKALMDRRMELKNVTIMIRQPHYDLGWLQGDFGDSFSVILDTQAGIGSRALNEKRVDYVPYLTSLRFKHETDPRRKVRGIDVLMLVVSTPDDDGFCSFGLYLSHKRDYARRAKKILAEVSSEPSMRVRIPGDNQIHVSEIDFFVEHIPIPHKEEPPKTPGDTEKRIAEYVSILIHDGDTLQLGPGLVASSLVPSGAFDNKNDLGIHSPIINKGLLDLVRRGIINGKYKSVGTNRSVSGGFRGITKTQDIYFIDGNQHFEVRDMTYVNDIRVIASHDNMTAINSVLAVDLAGQIAVDSLGTRMLGGAGGQIEFAIGAMLSNGGRSIAVLHSTASDGKISRIVPTHENGTLVSIPRTFADYVVTEYGIASLWAKSQRERARELIAVAHPDFRAELRADAERLY